MKSTILYSILSCIALFTVGCSSSSDDTNTALPHKGAKTVLMQNVADNLPELQSVEKDSMWSVTDECQRNRGKNGIPHIQHAHVDCRNRLNQGRNVNPKLC
ncbi:MAG: hypothetical protein ACLTGI_07960 [Hoylesella buccalis]